MNKEKLQIIIIILALTTIVSIAYFKFVYAADSDNSVSEEFVEPTAVPTPTPIPEPVAATSKTLFFGDIFWGRRVHNWSMASELKYQYPFSGLETFEKEKYDAWIGNLECPVTDGTVTTYQEETLLKFNCRPEYLPEAAKWFDVFSLSNNHTMNMDGQAGLDTTRVKLDAHNIQYFGHYENSIKQDLCEVVSINAKTKYADGIDMEVEEIQVPVVMCGYHSVFKLPLQSEMAVIADYAEYLPVIVMPHQGAEYQKVSDNYKKSIFRTMIDYGADAVIGGHPHTVQETENYKNKLIVYSLGNFIFDQQWSKDVTQGIGIEVNFEFTYDENFEKWLTFAEECKEFKDDCLEKADQLNLTKPDYQITYGIVATDSSNKLTKKGSEQDRADMLARTNFRAVNASLREALNNN